ncbi:hypothetical protein LDENG_00167210 [Lucifuga dentata]|nr:hypothetical protein LDENG_00167210 [Lucifuga dentata]
MDVTSHSCDITEGRANKSHDQADCVTVQPAANGMLPQHDTEEAPPPHPERTEDGVTSDDSPPTSNRLSSPKTERKEKHSCSLPHHHHHHHSTNQKRLSSTKSHASFKTDAAQIKEVAGDDCCVHCLLACLFCELWSMCSVLGECLACGGGGAGCCDAGVGCCCCMEAAGEAACSEEACQAVLDCGIVEECCGSSDCLEVCLECCSICFPS